MAPFGKYYSSGRLLSLNNRHHRALFMLCGVIAVAYFVSQLSSGETLFDSIIAGVNMGFTMFIAWGLTREIDPDRPESALGAAALAAVGIVLLDASSNLIAGGILVLTARCVNQSTGLRFKILDVLGLVILAGVVALTAQWVLGLVAGFGLLLDSVSERPSNYARLGAAIVAAVTLIVAYLSDSIGWSFLFTNADISALITGFVAARFVVPNVPDPLQSVGDYTGEPLNRQRVMYTVTLMALALILVSWSGDDNAAFGILPLWAGLITVIAYQARDRFMAKQGAS